jgi:hypothetical protein
MARRQASCPRKRASRWIPMWIPAYAGMTGTSPASGHPSGCPCGFPSQFTLTNVGAGMTGAIKDPLDSTGSNRLPWTCGPRRGAPRRLNERMIRWNELYRFYRSTISIRRKNSMPKHWVFESSTRHRMMAKRVFWGWSEERSASPWIALCLDMAEMPVYRWRLKAPMHITMSGTRELRSGVHRKMNPGTDEHSTS